MNSNSKQISWNILLIAIGIALLFIKQYFFGSLLIFAGVLNFVGKLFFSKFKMNFKDNAGKNALFLIIFFLFSHLILFVFYKKIPQLSNLIVEAFFILLFYSAFKQISKKNLSNAQSKEKRRKEIYRLFLIILIVVLLIINILFFVVGN